MWLIKHTFSLEICGWCLWNVSSLGIHVIRGKGKLEIARNPSSSGRSPVLSLKPRVFLVSLFSVHSHFSPCQLPEELPSPHIFFFCRSLTLLRIPQLSRRHPHLFLHCLAAVPAAVLFSPPHQDLQKTPLGQACVFTLDHIMEAFKSGPCLTLRVTAEHIFKVSTGYWLPSNNRKMNSYNSGQFSSTVVCSWFFVVYVGSAHFVTQRVLGL